MTNMTWMNEGSDFVLDNRGKNHITIDPDGAATFAQAVTLSGDVTASADFSLAGALSTSTRSISSSGNSAADDHVILVDSSGGAVTVTLRSEDVEDGREIVVKDSGGSAATNNVTVATEASETIDGAATSVISTNYGSNKLVSDGTNWFTV